MDAKLSEMFNKKIELLEKKLLSKKKTEIYNSFSNSFGRCAVFFSVSNITEQAYVFRAEAENVEKAWNEAKEKASEFILEEDYIPNWIKADVTYKGERKSLKDTLSMLSCGYPQFFRKGISFDEQFDRALIETELNTAGLIDYKRGSIDIGKLNNYFVENDLKTLTQFPDEVIVFSCKSALCDEKNAIHSLYSEGKNCGRRRLKEFEKMNALSVISTSADYLAMQIGFEGKFDYGIYPTFPKPIKGYNILRHASSIWCLLCSYRITNDKFILSQAESAIKFLIRNMMYKYPNREGKENVLYLFEETKKEVKIGGNAIAIVVLTEYMDLVGKNEYTDIVKSLGLGILELFDERDGSFFHVLKFPSFAPLEKFRTVYYDGESVFALSRAYGVTKDKRFLDAAKMAVDRFIENNYEQYADHWVAYSVNELTKYLPQEKYLCFGIKNVMSNLEKIHKQPTTFHTYLELLCVSFELASRIKSENPKSAALKDYDEKALVDTIFHRADFMLNGYGYPEYVMYFPNPQNTLGSFFIRHDNFRIRIDDVQHFCCAYYSVYRNYEKLNEIRNSK